MPVTVEKHDRKLQDPAVCELLPVRDYLDGVMVRTSGALVAGYELRGVNSYFGSDEERDRNKGMLGALLKSIPEQSMRMQIRYEVIEDLGNLLENYAAQSRMASETVRTLDFTRLRTWNAKVESGHYLRPVLHVYFIWEPRIHHRVTGQRQNQAINFSLSARASIERSRREHEKLLAEFESLLVGIETTMQAAELGARRMSVEELFLETKRALNPFAPDKRSYIPAEDFFEYHSAREQLADVSILHEAESYINLDGILYSLVSLKELPDATFAGILRELATLDFPIVVSAQVTIPDQTKVLKSYKSRLKKMQAAQRDTHGGFRVNVEAQVAESQLFRVQQDIIASSLEDCKAEPGHRHADLETGEHAGRV